MIRTFLLLYLLFSLGIALGGEDLFTIHLLDPRVVTHTEKTMSTEWQQKTDVLGSKDLTDKQVATLRPILRAELIPKANDNFCGHQPIYAIQRSRAGNVMSTITLCGMCGTWARAGQRNNLGGMKSIDYLDTVLPIPGVFKGEPAKVLGLDRSVPFEKLAAAVPGKP